MEPERIVYPQDRKA